MRLAALFLLLLHTGSAGEPKLPAEVERILKNALAAPPQFTANAILRLWETGKIPKTAERELLEVAFARAGRAQDPVPMIAVPGTTLDTRSGYRSAAMRQGLDAVTLQSRAILAMLTVDREAARQLYARMTPPVFEKSSCESPLVAGADSYYELLTRLAVEAYKGGDGEKNSRLDFGRTVISRVTSHVEVAPLARMLAAVDWTAPQFTILAGRFASKLLEIEGDDRSFSYSAERIEQAVGEVVVRARQYGENANRIAEAYRAYLAANLHAVRCADTASAGARLATGGTLELFGARTRGELSALTEEETRPTKVGAEPKVERYWQTDAARALFEQCRQLRTGPNGLPFSEAERSTREWRRQLGEFLNALAGWQPSTETSDRDYYHQRAIVYEALLELTPAGELRNRVLDEFVAFLKSSNLQDTDPVEWFWHARSTLNRVRTAQPEEAIRLVSAFATSGNTLLVLDAMLEQIAPDYSLFKQ